MWLVSKKPQQTLMQLYCKILALPFFAEVTFSGKHLWAPTTQSLEAVFSRTNNSCLTFSYESGVKTLGAFEKQMGPVAGPRRPFMKPFV